MRSGVVLSMFSMLSMLVVVPALVMLVIVHFLAMVLSVLLALRHMSRNMSMVFVNFLGMPVLAETKRRLDQSNTASPQALQSVVTARPSGRKGHQLVQLLKGCSRLLVQRDRGILDTGNACLELAEFELVRDVEGFGNSGDLLQVAGKFSRVLADVEGQDDIIGDTQSHQTEHLGSSSLDDMVS